MKKKILSNSLFCVILLLIITAAVSLTILVGNADTYYTVRVEYRFVDDSTAYDTYVAVLAEGTDVDITVTNPALPGYTPMKTKTPEQGQAPELYTHLTYEDLSDNHVVTVYYVPVEVHYRVHYYKQNIRDDLYTEDLTIPASETERTGLTGGQPEGLDKTFEGFTQLSHDPDTIAADGSTQFRIYYDRNYYLINFDLDGGYGVEPIYGKFDSVYNIPTPTKKGWNFKGWVLANENGEYVNAQGTVLTYAQAVDAADPFTSGRVPSHNVNYKAVWEAGATQYTIVYWVENADSTEYTDVASHHIDTYSDGTPVMSDDVLRRDDADKIPDFFSFNLNPHAVEMENGKIKLDGDLRPIYLTNDEGKPIDKQGNVIDFPEMSPGERKELNGKGRYFSINTERSDTEKTVSGDGTTTFNVYYDRRQITQRFFFARKTSDGKYQIPGLTKAFSTGNGTFDQHLSGSCAGGRTDWMELSADRPQIAAKYQNKLIVKDYYSAFNNATYYYYELTTEYGSNMRDNWLEDAFDPLLITKNNKSEGEGDCALFGAWSVEWGTPYATKGNKTVKGIYEKLDDQLLYTDEYLSKDYGAQDNVLNYLSFWANAKNQDWNKKDTFYNFSYMNYVEILPSEYNADKTAWNGQGGYIDTKVVHYNVENDPTMPTKIKIYGLLPENLVETYDGGTQYTSECGPGKKYKDRDEAVRVNQTAAALTGFELLTEEEVAKTDDLTYNTECEWKAENGFDADHHANIRFYYRRRYYSLIFLNNNVNEDPSLRTRNIYYNHTINSVGIRNNFVYFEPVYPDADMRDYYVFGGWCFDQDFDEVIPTKKNDPDFYNRTHFNSDFRMPADDVTLYAKWDLIKEDVRFYYDYNAMIGGEEPIGSCAVDYNSLIYTQDVPGPTAPQDASFAGWYFLDETNTPVRFDPASMPVTRELNLYARWWSDDTASYLITYVEKGTDTEVAPPTAGTAFVHQTKTFQAKMGSELNEAHRTGVGENIWRPSASSHSLCMRENETGQLFAPNTYAFEYVQKQNVWYRVRYLDAVTKKEIHTTKVDCVPHAIVTESSVTIEDYIADDATKSAVLAASDAEDAAVAMQEELEANTIIFYYTPNTGSTLYRVDHYIQKTDGSGYELNKQENNTGVTGTTLTVSDVFDYSPTAQSLTAEASGFTHVRSAVDGEEVPDESTFTLGNDPRIISFYYDRNKYAYKVLYVDYETEATLNTIVYNGDDQLEPVDKIVTIQPDTHYDYVPSEGADPICYTRISDRTLTLSIHPDERTDPKINVITVYYRRDIERRINFEVSCDHETDDDYAQVSDSYLIVKNQDEIRPVTAIPAELDDHEYTFLGWYTVPHPTQSDVPFTAGLTITPPFPGADITYYAVFHQEQVSMQLDIMYNDTGEYDDDAQLDANGSVTGHVPGFDNPVDYTAGGDTPKDKIGDFQAKVERRDGNTYLYEFAGWYYEDASGSIVRDNVNPGPLLNVPMNRSWHYIAMFKKAEEAPYRISFRFTPRLANSDTSAVDGRNEFVVKGILTNEEFETAVTYGDNGPMLTHEFVLAQAPFESNHGETLSWGDGGVTSGTRTDGLYAIVIADQEQQTVTVNYRLDPDDAFTAFQTTVGSNRNTDTQIAQLDVRDKAVNGKYFSYWEIRNDSGEIIALCYEPWFSFRVWENYQVTPVFNSDTNDAPAPPDDPTIRLTKLDDSRNRWTDSEGNLRANAYSDYLYTDFEVAFEGPDIYNDASYTPGLVFEVCAKYTDGLDLSQCNYYTDEENLKTALKNTPSGNARYVYDKREQDSPKQRTIQINPISVDDLSTRSRSQFGKAFRNVINASTQQPTNGNYVFKVYAYLIKDGQVTLSNPVYVCMHDTAVKDWMPPVQTDSP